MKRKDGIVLAVLTAIVIGFWFASIDTTVKGRQPEQLVHIYQLQCQSGGEKMYLRPGSNEVVDWIGLTLQPGGNVPYVYCAIVRIR